MAKRFYSTTFKTSVKLAGLALVVGTSGLLGLNLLEQSKAESTSQSQRATTRASNTTPTPANNVATSDVAEPAKAKTAAGGALLIFALLIALLGSIYILMKHRANKAEAQVYTDESDSN